MTTGTSLQREWDKILHEMSEEDRSPFGNVKTLGRDQRHILDDILQATREKKEECRGKRWKIKVRGRTIIPHDLREKILV
jgi:hypothetical protein